MGSKRFSRHLLHGFLSVSAVLSASPLASAKAVPASEQLDRTDALPERLRGVDVQEHLGDNVPRGARFIDETGKAVTFGDLFDGKHPVILTLNYSRCPMLCSLELNGLVASLKQLDWTAGGEFQIATVVLDPNEKPEQAAESKARYLRQTGRPQGASGWHFLTGPEASIKQVASAVGFSYSFNEE